MYPKITILETALSASGVTHLRLGPANPADDLCPMQSWDVFNFYAHPTRTILVAQTLASYSSSAFWRVTIELVNEPQASATPIER